MSGATDNCMQQLYVVLLSVTTLIKNPLKIKGLYWFWLPGRDAQQNFFTYHFIFSAPHLYQNKNEKTHKNRAVKSKGKLVYSNPMTLALEWLKGLEEGRYASRAAIAKELGISRTRVTQIMNVLRLPSDLLRDPLGNLTERKIRAILNGLHGQNDGMRLARESQS